MTTTPCSLPTGSPCGYATWRTCKHFAACQAVLLPSAAGSPLPAPEAPAGALPPAVRPTTPRGPAVPAQAGPRAGGARISTCPFDRYDCRPEFRDDITDCETLHCPVWGRACPVAMAEQGRTYPHDTTLPRLREMARLNFRPARNPTKV